MFEQKPKTMISLGIAIPDCISTFGDDHIFVLFVLSNVTINDSTALFLNIIFGNCDETKFQQNLVN